jgi:hypothetical protein
MIEGLDDITLTIPVPSYIPRGRGLHAVGKFDSTLKAKCTIEEKALVLRAAEHYNMSFANFVRWVAVHSAKEVLKDVPHS